MVVAQVGLQVGVGQVGRLLALEHLKAHVGPAQISRDDDEVSGFGAAAPNGLPLIDLAQNRDRQRESAWIRRGVSAHEVHPIGKAGLAQAAKDLVEGFDREAVAHRHGYG